MFNLLVFNVDWQSGQVTVPISRMFEYTEEHIKNQFHIQGIPAFEQLIRFPCIFCVEGTYDEIGWVGQINRTRTSGVQVILDISFDAEVPPLQNRMMFEKRVELDIQNEFEFSRNHWAVKDIDLYRFLLRNVRPRRQRPSVFQIAEHESIDRNLVSVMIPFDAAFDPVLQAIRQAAENVQLRSRRADDIWENAAIIQDVVAPIDKSLIVVCDCTGRNPNVFYEAGIAHTLGREVIIIAQSENDIPFDLRHLRYIRYHNNGEGLAALTEALQSKMQAILGH